MNPDEAWILAEDYYHPNDKSHGSKEDVFSGVSNGNSSINGSADVFGSGGTSGGGAGGSGGGEQLQLQQKQRRLVTLADIRREYQDELDRMAVLESGQFPIVGESFLGQNGDGDGDVMDVF